jgi:DNA-binding NtrC family response regulator
MDQQANGDVERILIADDEQATRDFLYDLLTKDGYRCEAAADGTQVLRRLVKFDPALVISDVRMPGLNGLELLRLVRQHFPDTSIIIITGYGTVDDAAGVIEQGASDYILKPLDLAKVRSSVKTVLENRRARLSREPAASLPKDHDDPIDGDSPLLPSDLQAVVTAWPSLPEAVRAEIVAMIAAAHRKD